jgi:beta-N-acetylhexosaminidase
MSRDPEQLALRCLLAGFEGLTVPDWLADRIREGLGGVVLFARNVASAKQVRELTAELRQARAGLVIAIDEEGGDVTRLEARTGSSYPGNLALGEVDDLELTRAVAAAIGSDLARAGVNLDLAPVADLNSDPRNPVIGVRSFGDRPERVAAHVAAFVNGLQSAGVAACAKHFPGHGATPADSHRELPVVADDPAALSAALLPFRAAIAAGVRAVMTAHVVLPAYDARPATLSPRILGDLLRGELGFDGVVVTDGIDMAAIADGAGMEGGSVAALAAGADAICIGGGPTDPGTVDRLARAIAAGVEGGFLDEARLRGAGDRLAGIALPVAPAQSGGRSRSGIGMEAARRAIRTQGDVRLGPRALIVELGPEPGMAAGEAGWSAGALIAERDPSATHIMRRGPRVDVESIHAQAAGRPLALVVRDLHRHDWARAAVEAIVAERPDARVIEMGVPAWRPDQGAHVATFGGSRASAIAVAERLYPAPTEGTHPAGAPTEGTHPAGEAIAGGDTATLLRLMLAEERAGVEAVGRVLPEVVRAVEAIASGLRRGGSLHYFGAGSSGRLAALDALECPATFGIDAERVVAHLAGDDAAEDDRELGARDAAGLAPGDAAVAVSASGRTAYALGALAHARAAGACTVAVTCAPGSPLGLAAEVAVEVPTGPELIAGSTRLKAGTVQKVVLSMLSTGVFTRLGHVYRGRMVDLRAGNEKLRRRAAAMVADLTGADPSRVGAALREADGNPKLAILMLRTGLAPDAARSRLRQAEGDLAAALGEV